jgi:hypothetical protein
MTNQLLNRRLRDSGILEQADRGMPQRMKTKLARRPSFPNIPKPDPSIPEVLIMG